MKYLLQHHAEAFLRFGLGLPEAAQTGQVKTQTDAELTLLKPLASALPSTGREMDGAYLIDLRAAGQSRPQRRAVDIEFSRRHQGHTEMALDIGEAQVRLFRRERVPVCTLVFDLYGRKGRGPVVRTERFPLGQNYGEAGEGSVVVYQRVNLRALGYQELLERAPPALWPLVPLTCDGTSGEALRRTREALRLRPLPAEAKADLLASLRFLAEAEKVPTSLLERYISLEDLMNSPLLERLIERDRDRLLRQGRQEGRQEGIQEGVQKERKESRQDAVLTILELRLGQVPAGIRNRVRAESRVRVLDGWYKAALAATDAEAARKLLARIRAAAPRPAPPRN